MKPVRWLALLACSILVFAQEEVDNEESRKVLGSSVVTSVSVIMDHGNGTKTYIADAAGQPVDQTEGAVGSPVDLLNPDRYEFYTFDETGDLVKRLMTLDQIKGLLAGGDGETLDNPSNSPTFYHESLSSSHIDDSDLEPNMAQGVHSVVASVQNVLRSELEASKTKVSTKPPLSIPDSISSWSMLFPAIISDSSEALDDGSDTGNSVNEPIDGGDRLPASSNVEETEVKVSPEDTIEEKNATVTEKPTAVPPIIHFLEIQSVPSPAKGPTKIPVNLTSTTLAITSTTESPTTTGKPTSPENSIQEMSASISDVLSQVTDNQTSINLLKTAEGSKITESSVSSPTTESLNKLQSGTKSTEKTPIVIIPILKPDSSNVNTVTTNPQESISKESPVTESKLNNATESSSTVASVTTEEIMKLKLESQTTTKDNMDSTTVTKKTSDEVVSLLTTPKPSPTMKVSTSENNKNKPLSAAASSIVKQKIQSTTPTSSSSVKKNNVKTSSSTTSAPTTSGKIPPKKTNKPSTNVNKTTQSTETLEAHGSEEVIKVVPNKQSQATITSNKTKINQNKSNVSSQTSTSKPSTKPHKKVAVKPLTTEAPHDCTNSKTTPPVGVKNKEKIEVAASTNVNERIQPSKLKTPVLQEIKTIQKPTTGQYNKATTSKVRPSDEIKITTYKPSTSQPFTTKQSIHKISTTTERPISEHKIPSASKIHEVNSSLFDIKDQVVSVPNKSEPQSSKLTALNGTKIQNKVSNYEVAASSTDETKVPVPLKTPPKESSHHQEHNSTDGIDHKKEVECTHSKKPLYTSIQDKISDSSEDFAASNSDEVRLTTTTTAPVPDITTDVASKDVTTEGIPETSTSVSTDEMSTITEQSEEMATEMAETTTLNISEMDFVKEGISAVTNILLDTKPPLEPQLPIPTIPLSESASNIVASPPVKGELKHAASFDDFEMTTTDLPEENSTGSSSPSTEKEVIIYFTTNEPITEKSSSTASATSEKERIVYFTTTDIPEAETVPPTTENIVNSNDTTKSSEGITELVTDSETSSVDAATESSTSKEVENKEPSESKIVNTITNQTLPTKESKLSPENMNETQDLSIPCNHTLSPINSTDNNESKEQLEPAQSIISEINKTTSEPTTISSTTPIEPEETTPKNSLKDESFNLDFKTALRPEPSKIDRPFTQVKYPSLQNAYRPLQDVPVNPPSAVELHPAPHESMGLEATTAFLADDVRRFSDLCNELAFRMWTSITGKGSISSRSLVLSPFATTSLLAMVFLGARGPTSGQMNDVLRLDDMVTFNPHQVLQNVTESVLNSRNYGVTTAAFVRELYSDKLKGKILDFYKERAQQYYDGHVEEISFNTIGDILRRRTNLLVKRQTLGKVPEYLRGSNLNLRPPLAAFSANIFQTDCDLASTEGRDGEMYFVVRPSTRQRRLVPVPAAVWRTGFLAGYEPGLDATAVALGTDSVASTILVLPGQQGQVAPGDGLARLEQRLIETSYRRGGWTRLLRSLLPRPGLELQVPRFSHRSVLNITSTLQRMGLKDLFNENKADLRGLNGLSNDLHLSDIVQVNTFSTCGEDTIGARHHIETYPVSPQRMGRDDPETYPRPEDFEDPELLKIPLNLRPRQARLPDNPRLRFDRPFLYMVRHNPTGMILHMGRFNPRLLP